MQKDKESIRKGKKSNKVENITKNKEFVKRKTEESKRSFSKKELKGRRQAVKLRVHKHHLSMKQFLESFKYNTPVASIV